MKRAAILVLAAVGLAACGQVPQPFRHDGSAPRLTRPNLPRGVTIRPPAIDLGNALAVSLAGSLEEVHEIPATVQTGPAFGHVVEAEVVDGDAGRALVWRLRAPDGTVSDVRVQPLPATQGVQAEGRETARLLAARLADPNTLPPPGAAPVKRVGVRLVPFSGLPGDGDRAMNRATRVALERAGLLVTDDGADYMVQGRVTVAPGLPGQDTVTVTWAVKGKDGADLASIDQQGAVPHGRLDIPWGSLARDIAEGGAAGVMEAVKAAGQKP